MQLPAKMTPVLTRRPSLTPALNCLFVAALFWAIKIVIYVAFISLFIAIVATAFYHFYWADKDK